MAAGSKGMAFARVAADGSGKLEGAKALVEGLDETQTAALIERTGACCVRVCVCVCVAPLPGEREAACLHRG